MGMSFLGQIYISDPMVLEGRALCANRCTGSNMPKKERSYRTLKNALDHIFSEWVRRRWADLHGYVRCVCCGTVKQWNDGMHAGHFVSRVHLATRWEPRNVAPVCSTCNVLKRGNMAEYSLWISKKYGPGIMQQLIDLKNKTVKFHRSQLEGMIDDYRGRIANLGIDGALSQGGKEVGDNALRLHGARLNDS
jgi:hypothetical protein